MTTKKKGRRTGAAGATQEPSHPSNDEALREEAQQLLEAEAQEVADADERNPVLPSLHTNPFGAATIVLDRFFTKDEVRLLVYYREDWYQYKNQRWVLVTKEDVQSILYKCLLLCRQVDAEGEIHPFVTSQPNVSKIYFQIENNETIRSDLTVPCVREPDGSWREVDVQGQMVCRGEIVDMRAGKSKPTLYTFVPNGADWCYDPKAEDCPVWKDFLCQLFGDKTDEIAMLQEFAGYLLSGDTWAQKGLIVVGPPRAGKGVIGNVLTQLLGESMVSSPALHAIGSRFGLESMIDKRMCLISDARLSNRQDIFAVIETLLRIIGEDSVSVDRKNKNALNLKLGVRVLMLSNEMPHLPDNSTAINNRFLIIKLRESFLGREDVHLLDKLLEELPAIANWAIKGYRRLVQTYKFTEPQSSRDERNEWRVETNPLEEFVKGYCQVRPGLVTAPAGFAEKYNIWRGKNGMPAPVASNSLSKALKAMLGDGFDSRWVGNKRCWKGIKLNARGKELKRPPPAF